MATIFEAGEWVWIQDAAEVVVPGKVVATFRAGETGKVLVDDMPRTLSAAETTAVTYADKKSLDDSVDNLTTLDDLNENSLLNLVRARYTKNRIYTNIGSILISVNPFRPLPLYTPQQIDLYKEGPRGKAPHVFAVGHNAYYELLNERRNQSIIITGESGAGKSEACKLVLQFIADLSSSHSGKASVPDDDTALEQQLLQANPILEAFGNAKTVRNNNSSRFGKLITVKFDKLGSICESTVVSYLLEKSRVVQQSQGERNYHIFYEMVAAAEEDPYLRKTLRLEACEQFNYLSQSGVTRIEGVVDENDYDEVLNAMEVLKFNDEEINSMWPVLAAILHFGNIRFTDKKTVDRDEDAKVVDQDVLNFCSSLLGIDPKAFVKVLTTRMLSVGKVVVPYKVKEASDTRDAMCKHLYHMLFEWIIRRINDTLESNSGSMSARNTKDSVIGLLDIFGFEQFVTNSYEQLCINYCNEKLNNHFNEHVFKHELDIYASEGIKVEDLAFKDNAPILDLLENSAAGVYSMLDEQIMVNGTDDKYLGRLQNKFASHPHFLTPKRKTCPDPDFRNCFGIQHFAGEVYYNVKGFLEKNKDALHPDVVEALQSSKNHVMIELFDEHAKSKAAPIGGEKGNRSLSPGRGARKGKMATGNTLGKQFKAQLDALMVTLNKTDPHYIRCMKPNSEKRGAYFQSPMMLEQLRYSGLLEVCRIRKMGFPIRRSFSEFLGRYKVIHPLEKSLQSLITRLISEGVVKDSELKIGKTKVLMKQSQANEMDVAREKALEGHAVLVQAIARGFLTRKRLNYYQMVVRELKKWMAKRDEDKLTYWLQQAAELPNQGQHLPTVVQAEKMLRRVQEENKVVGLIEDALTNCDLNALLSAIADAERMSPPLQHKRLDDAMRMKDLLEEEKQIKASMLAAIASKDCEVIGTLLKRAETLGIVNEETKQGKALKMRIEEEATVMRSLRESAALKEMATLQTALNKAADMGLTGPDVEEAKSVYKDLNTKSQATKDLATATTSRYYDGICSALLRMEELGIKYAPEIEAAKKVKTELEQQQKAVEKLQEAMDSMDLKVLENAIAVAEGMGLTKQTAPELADAISTREAIKRKMEADAAKLVGELNRAVSAGDAEQLAAAIARVMAAGLGSRYGEEISAAKERQRQLMNQQKAKQALELALRTKSLDRVEEAMLKAEGCGYKGREVEDARILMLELGKKKEVYAEIQAAIQNKDMGALTNLLRDAEQLDMEQELDEWSELQEMKNSLNRDEKIKEVKEKLAEGLAHEDLTILNKAMAMAIELGCEGDADVQSARAMQKRLNSVEEAKSKIMAAQRSLGVKIQSKNGISDVDMTSLKEALAEAREVGIEEDSSFMVKAVVLQDRCDQQLEAQQMLTQALASLNKTKMREALEFADELELQLEMTARVRRALRRIEVMRDDDTPLDGGLSTMTEEDIEQFKAERDKRHAKASNPKYKFQNYPRLRSRADYAKGTLLHKKREMERMLLWQSSVPNKSLEELPKELVKDAVTVRKSLLGYMGDKQMSFPETLAQNILMKGLEKPRLRDEIYLQMMKQLSENPKPDSTAKGWQVMCMCCGTFLPSLDFENYLLNFILEKCQYEGAEACYAKYCLHTLEGMMSSRTNEGIVPTLEEIQAYKERPPILATIELVNGALLTEDLPVAPDLNVKKVLEICAHFGGLQSARTDMMGLFVYDLGNIEESELEAPGSLPWTPTPLRNEDFMGDQFIRKARQRRDFKFVYKRKIALHSHPWPTQDAAFNRMVYLQGEDDVIRTGTLEVDDRPSVVLLSAISMAMDMALEGDAFTEEEAIRKEIVNYIPPGWQGQEDVVAWSKDVMKLWPDLISKDRHELEIMFVEQIRDRPMYGSHFFYACKVQCVPDLMSNLPKNLLLAFNADGMHIFNVEKKQMLQAYSFADVHSWRGTRRQVSLTIWDQDTDSVFELALKTQQAQDMAAIILDHINAILANNGRN